MFPKYTTSTACLVFCEMYPLYIPENVVWELLV